LWSTHSFGWKPRIGQFSDNLPTHGSNGIGGLATVICFSILDGIPDLVGFAGGQQVGSKALLGNRQGRRRVVSSFPRSGTNYFPSRGYRVYKLGGLGKFRTTDGLSRLMAGRGMGEDEKNRFHILYLVGRRVGKKFQKRGTAVGPQGRSKKGGG